MTFKVTLVGNFYYQFFKPRTHVQHGEFLPAAYTEHPHNTYTNIQDEQDTSMQRFIELKKLVKVDDDHAPQIHELLYNFTDVFHIKGDKLTFCDLIEHTIPLIPNSQPVNIRPYTRRSKFESDEIEKKVQELIDQGIVEPCRSPYNSPLHLVKKGVDENGVPITRLVVDFRKLNLLTFEEHHPTIQAVDIYDQLHGMKYYSKLDLLKGFYQVKMSKSCRDKTAFSSGYKHLRFVRMPLGLRSATHTFNRLMHIALEDLIGTILYIFLDDIFVFSKTIEEHIERLQTLFTTLRKHNLKLSPSKCELLQTKLSFLGFVVSELGVEVDPSKFETIKNFPQPRTPRAIKSFLGLLGYYRSHINRFADHAKPLTFLLKKGVKFIWSPECQVAFDHFKHCLTTAPILQYPNFGATFRITTDASKVALSAILSQSPHGQDLPIAYAIRTLSDAETRYSTAELELAAIVWGIRHYAPYISSQYFEVYTAKPYNG